MDRARYKLDRQRVDYRGICTHLADARCHADISRSYNRRISSMERRDNHRRRTSRLHQRSRPSSSRSPRWFDCSILSLATIYQRLMAVWIL